MSEPNEKPANRTEYGWVIEGSWSGTSGPDYWMGSGCWSKDHMQALRFARRQDAQQAADLMLSGVSHWMPLPKFEPAESN